MNYFVAGLVGMMAIGWEMKLAIALPVSAPANTHATEPQAEQVDRSTQPTAAEQLAEQLHLDPSIVEESPTLQRWLEGSPDVLAAIRNDPSFRTRLRVGYSQYPDDGRSGIALGVEDVFVGRSRVTVSGEYQSDFAGDRQRYGADLRYYVLPLGSYVNVAPVVGYRHIETEDEAIDGANLGLRVLLSLSRTGASDISLSQTWVAPGTDEETGMTTLSVGYAVTQQLRVSTDLQRQNAPKTKDDRIGINLEWML